MLKQWECLDCARVIDATADDYCPHCGRENPEPSEDRIMSHTPGPWSVDTTVVLGAYGVWTDYPHPKNPGHDGTGYPVMVCSLTVGKVSDWLNGPISRKERGANAALIAAAPDLLAACEAMIIELNCLIQQTASKEGGSVCKARDLGRAAVAKAKPVDVAALEVPEWEEASE